MTKPLALVFYENLLPGSQLVNRLHDLGYRVQTTEDAGKIVEEARQSKPIVFVADLASRNTDICAMISKLKENLDTRHIPVLAFTTSKDKKLQAAARAAGTTLIASDAAILAQLPQLLDQVLEVE